MEILITKSDWGMDAIPGTLARMEAVKAAGFDGFGAQVEAGRDSINHVVLAKAHREERIKRPVQANGKSRPKNARPVASSPKRRQLVPA